MRRMVILAAQAVALMVSSAALGTDYNWTNGAGTVSWGDASNWSPAGVPGAGDRLVISSELVGGPQTIDLGGPRQIDSIVGQGLSGVYTFSNSGAGALEMGAVGGGGVLLDANTPGWVQIDSNLLLARAGEVQFATQSPSSRIIVNGNVSSSAAAGTTALTLTTTNPNLADVIVVNGVISDGANARMTMVVGDVLGPDLQRGQVLVSGLNTYSGATTVNGGILAFTSIGDYGASAAASALGAPVTIDDGTITLGSNVEGIVNVPGTLRYVGTAAAGHSSNRPIRFVGRSPGGWIEASGAGPLVLSGGVSSTASTGTDRSLVLAGSNTGDNTMSGVIEDVPDAATQSLVKTGSGKWILGAANTYVGATTVTQGTLVIGNGGAIGSAALPTSGVVIGGTGVLRMEGGSITTNYLSRPSEAAVDFRSGTVTVVGPNSSGTGPGTAVLDIGTAGAGTLNVNGGSLTALAINVNGPDDAVNLSGGILVTNNLDNSHGGTVGVISGTLMLNSATAGSGLTTGAGTISGQVSGAGGLRKVGTGTVSVSGVMNYSGFTTVAQGTLHVTPTGKLSDFSSMTINSTGVLELDGSSTVVSSLSGSGLVNFLNNATLTVGRATPGVGGGQFSGTIQGSGNLVKRGPGTLTLSGNNTYSGSTSIEDGVLEVSSLSNIGSGAINLGSSSVAATLRYIGPGTTISRAIGMPGAIGGGTIESSGPGALIVSGAITPTAGAKTLTLSGNNLGDNTVSGNILETPDSGLMSLVKSGPGRWILNGAKSYAGSTTVNQGELIVTGADAAIGGTTITVASGATLTFDGGAINPSGGINVAGTLNLRSGTMTINTNSNLTGVGNFIIGSTGAGTLSIVGGSNHFGRVTLQGPDDSLNITNSASEFSVLDNSAGGAMSFDVGIVTVSNEIILNALTMGTETSIQGTGGLTKVGSGTLTFNSAHSSYAGPTHVVQGKLQVTSGAFLPSSSAITVDAGATLEYLVGGTDSISMLNVAGSVVNNRSLTIGGNSPSGQSVGVISGNLSGTGSLIRSGSGTLTISGNAIQNAIQVTSGVLQISGAVSGINSLTVGNNGNVAVGGSVAGGFVTNNGTITVDGGQLVFSNALNSNQSSSILRLNSGGITTSQLAVAVNNSPYVSTFSWTAGTIHLTGPAGVTIAKVTSSPESQTLLGSPDRPFKNLLTLNSGKSLIVDQTTTIGSGGTLNLSGGSFTTKILSVASGGAFNFNLGTLHFSQGQIFNSTFNALTHVDAPLVAGKNLIVDQTATVVAPLTLAGGTMTADFIFNPQNLFLHGGTLSLRVGPLEVSAGNLVDVSRGTVVDAGGGVTIAPTGELDVVGATLNASGPSANSGQLNAINSTLKFTGGLNGNGQVNLINSTLSTSGGILVGMAIASAGQNTVVGRLYGGNLNVSSGSLDLAADAGTNLVDTLSVGSGAQLNLHNNSMVIDSGNLTAITEQIRAGLNHAGGIVGAPSDADNRLGAIVNGVNGSPIYTEFEHVGPLHGGEILMKSTVVGDLNLDGAVTISDFIDLAANFGLGGDANWQKGDVNYDGAVTIADFIDLSAHFGQSLAGAIPLSGEDRAILSDFASQVGTAVPEPNVAILAIVGLSLMGWRRRSRT